MKSTEKKKKNEKTLDTTPFSSKTFIKKEKKHLTSEDINALIEKYKNIKPKPTIIGKNPYIPFLAGITDDTWMSIGEEFKEEE